MPSVLNNFLGLILFHAAEYVPFFKKKILSLLRCSRCDWQLYAWSGWHTAWLPVAEQEHRHRELPYALFSSTKIHLSRKILNCIKLPYSPMLSLSKLQDPRIVLNSISGEYNSSESFEGWDLTHLFCGKSKQSANQFTRGHVIPHYYLLRISPGIVLSG